jgi:hypothetical protein
MTMQVVVVGMPYAVCVRCYLGNTITERTLKTEYRNDIAIVSGNVGNNQKLAKTAYASVCSFAQRLYT